MTQLDPLPDPLPARWRVWFGGFKVFSGQRPAVARASIGIAKRDKLVLNLYLETFRHGKFPAFKEYHKIESFCIPIPLPCLKRQLAYIEASGKRIKLNGSHKWQERFYDLTEEVPRPPAKVAEILDLLTQAEAALQIKDVRQAVTHYNAANTEAKHLNKKHILLIAAQLRALHARLQAEVKR